MLRILLTWASVCGAWAANAAQAPLQSSTREALPDAPVATTLSDAPPTTPFALGEQWGMGGNFSIRSRYDRLVDHAAGTERAVTLLPQAQLALLHDDPGSFRFFTSIKVAQDVIVHSSPAGSGGDLEVELDEFYARWQLAPAASMTLGRARMSDSRNWLYGNSENKNDSLQVQYAFGKQTLQLAAIARDFLPRDLLAGGPERDSLSLAGVYEHAFAPAFRTSAYVVVQDISIAGAEADRRYAGLRARGTTFTHFRYWADSSFLRGHAAGQPLRSNAFDAGLVLTAPVDAAPRLVLSYARGSGDDDSADGVDNRFHPTGLGDNQHQYGGVSRFKYYGEALDPALSNLEIFTVAAGARFSERQSLDVVYHRYFLNTTNDLLYADGIDHLVTGKSRRVGESADLIYGYKNREAFEVELSVSFFRAGEALPAVLEDVLTFDFRVKYNFSPRRGGQPSGNFR